MSSPVLAAEHSEPLPDVDGHQDATPSPTSRREKIIKLSLLAILVGVILYVILDYTLPGLGHIAGILKDFLLWVENNPGQGVAAFAGVYVITTVLFIPGSLLTLGAGLVFGRALGLGLGVLLGSVSVTIGAFIGLVISFILGRYVLQEQAQSWFDKFKIMRAVDKAIEKEGFKLVALLRLSPVIPFSAFNYVMGLTKVSFRDYCVGSLGIIPGTVAYVFIGSSTSGLLGDDDDDEEDDSGSGGGLAQLLVFVIGGIATVIAIVMISIYARRALKKVLDETDEEEQAEGAEGRRAGGALQSKAKVAEEDMDLEEGEGGGEVQAPQHQNSHSSLQ